MLVESKRVRERSAKSTGAVFRSEEEKEEEDVAVSRLTADFPKYRGLTHTSPDQLPSSPCMSSPSSRPPPSPSSIANSPRQHLNASRRLRQLLGGCSSLLKIVVDGHTTSEAEWTTSE